MAGEEQHEFGRTSKSYSFSNQSIPSTVVVSHESPLRCLAAPHSFRGTRITYLHACSE